MATAVLGLGSSGSTGLSQELIDKLKAAERTARVEPIETRMTNITSVTEGEEGEQYTLEVIKSKVSDLMDKADFFDLYNSSTNVFTQVSADARGSSAVFDAVDANNLDEGMRTIVVGQLAQKDVYQSDSFSSSTSTLTAGSFTIAVGSADAQTVTITEGMTLADLATSINNLTGVTAGVEQVGTNSYRLIVRAEDTGTDSELTFAEGSNGISQLGLDDDANHILNAQNLIAKIDGIDYDISSNSLTLSDGLKITAVAVDSGVSMTDGKITTYTSTSSVSIAKDTTSIETAINDFVASYNELLTTINDELYDAESKMEDTSSLKSLLSTVKEMLFDSYGATTPIFGTQTDEYGDIIYEHSNVTNNDKTLFNYGFSFDADGMLSVDSTVLVEAIANNAEDLQALFVGSIENNGLGTRLKEYLNETLNFSTGLLYQYDVSLTDRLETLTEERDKAQEALDTKYATLLEQFAAYTAIITQMENAFGGLKMMIEQSTSSN